MTDRATRGPPKSLPQPLQQSRSSRAANLSSPTPRPWHRQRLPKPWLISGAAFVGLLGFYTASIVVDVTRGSASSAVDTNPQIDLNSIYNTTAERFDSDLGSTEFFSGISRLRKRLIKQAEGDVLESAVGTGRNLAYYKADKVESLLLADRSEGMLEVCKRKWRDQMAGRVWRGKFGFVLADLGEADVRKKLGEKKFDTIVQTFAVCSTEEPDQLLQNLGGLLKDDGRILLLEHGRSHYKWLNRFLDNRAVPRAKKFGCWWNRDVGAIVEKSGLQVLEAERYTLGTTWWFVLKRDPNRAQSREDLKPEAVSRSETSNSPPTQLKKNWWKFWS